MTYLGELKELVGIDMFCKVEANVNRLSYSS